MSIETVRDERLKRESVAAKQAATLREGLDLYASGNNVCQFKDGRETIITTCETHWDACLVLLAYGNRKQ